MLGSHLAAVTLVRSVCRMGTCAARGYHQRHDVLARVQFLWCKWHRGRGQKLPTAVWRSDFGVITPAALVRAVPVGSGHLPWLQLRDDEAGAVVPSALVYEVRHLWLRLLCKWRGMACSFDSMLQTSHQAGFVMATAPSLAVHALRTPPHHAISLSYSSCVMPLTERFPACAAVIGGQGQAQKGAVPQPFGCVRLMRPAGQVQRHPCAVRGWPMSPVL